MSLKSSFVSPMVPLIESRPTSLILQLTQVPSDNGGGKICELFFCIKDTLPTNAT